MTTVHLPSPLRRRHKHPRVVDTLHQIELTQVLLRLAQALARSRPAFPMMPGMPEKRTHDYVRHGTTSLFAEFDTSLGIAPLQSWDVATIPRP